MSVPKRGDRVRITVEAEYTGDYNGGYTTTTGQVRFDNGGVGYINRTSVVEVLPKAPALTFMGVDITDDMILAVAREVRRLQQAGRL